MSENPNPGHGWAADPAVVDLKRRVADEIRAGSVPERGVRTAVDWTSAVDTLDAALRRYLPVLGPLAPPQLAALAALIASGVHLADQAIHGNPPSNPYSPNP